MTGIIVMVVGLLTLIVGALIYFSSDNRKETFENGLELEKAIEMAVADGVLTENERILIKQIATEKGLDYGEIIADVENLISNSNADSETEIINYNKKNGDDFEKFIVQKFDKKYYTIKEWAGDKYINGSYAKTTTQPDILLEFKLKQKSVQLSVECKWRKKLFKNGVDFAKSDQFERYKNFQKNRKIAVFIAIGIGGKGLSPEQLFIVPLSEIDSNFIHINKLINYKKNIDSNFFFEVETDGLR
jgi:hypothetical protein